MLAPWWKAIPGRLETELEALRLAGIDFEPNNPDEAGFFEVALTVVIEGQPSRLMARYPDVFPYLRPEVYARELNLEHHQNPFQKNLCLLGRQSDLWLPSMTVAQLVSEQLPKVVRAAATSSTADAADLEEHQAEPISAFYPYQQDSICLIDGAWQLPSALSSGTGRIAVELTPRSMRATVLTFATSNGQQLASLSRPGGIPTAKNQSFRWACIDKTIVSESAVAFDERLVALLPELKRRNYENGLDLMLVAYPEETAWRTIGLGWVLLVRQPQKSKGSYKPDLRHFVRVTKVGIGDLQARTPEATPLASARVALFGLGCVGAPIALELGRAGIGQLAIVDHDFVEGGTIVRWPLGIPAVGQDKTAALQAFINANFPFTRLKAIKHRIGSIPVIEESRDADVLDDVLSTVDIVIDATAEFGIQHMLSDLALRRGLTYISAHATHGGFGGEVTRMKQGETGCWMCLAYHREDKQIPLPPSKKTDWLQPPGCASPTFEGASWDLSEVSLAAVRAVVDSVSAEPRAGWDVGVLSLRDNAGERIPPSWEVFRLKPHAKCTSCAARD